MKETFQYIKDLFYNPEVKLSKKDFISIFSVLFLITNFCSYRIFRNIGINILVKERGIEQLVSHNLLNNLYSVVYNFDVPWSFILLLFSLSLGHKFYSKTPLKWLLGFLIFVFFKTIPYIAIFFFKITDLYGKDFEVIQNDFLILKIGTGIFFIAGFLAFIYPINNSIESKNITSEQQKGISRGKFSRYILYLFLGFICFTALIVGIEFLFNKHDMFGNKISLVILSIALLATTVFYFIFIGKRLINAGKSALNILYLFLFSSIQSLANYLIFTSENSLIASISTNFLSISITATNLFILALMFIPSKTQKLYEST